MLLCCKGDISRALYVNRRHGCAFSHFDVCMCHVINEMVTLFGNISNSILLSELRICHSSGEGQRRFTSMLSAMEHFNYEERLGRVIFPVNMLRGDMIEV